MNCIDFTDGIIPELNEKQREHLRHCPECRLRWDETAPLRAMVETPFDPAKEPLVELSDKPPSSNWLTAEFRKELAEARQEATDAKADSRAESILALLTRLYPGNRPLQQKLAAIAAGIKGKSAPEQQGFNERFVATLAYFPEQEVKKLGPEELGEKIAEKLNNQGRTG